jgi:hypothetical protein
MRTLREGVLRVELCVMLRAGPGRRRSACDSALSVVFEGAVGLSIRDSAASVRPDMLVPVLASPLDIFRSPREVVTWEASSLSTSSPRDLRSK